MKLTRLKGSATTGSQKVDVTYSNGIFTGAFNVTDDCGSTVVSISGSFGKDGKLNGKWCINDYNYLFKNGVLVGGDEMSSDKQVISSANKYANKQMTEAQLFANNMVVYESSLYSESLYDYVYNLLDSSMDPCGVLDNDETCAVRDAKWKDLDITYEYVGKAPYFTDKGFAEFYNRYCKLEQSKYYDLESFLSTCNLEKEKNTGGWRVHIESSYKPYGCTVEDGVKLGGVWLYYLTNTQLTTIKEAVEAHNKKIDERNKALLTSKLNGYSVNINGKYYTLISYKETKEYSRETGVTIEFNCRPQDSKDLAYSSYTAEVSGNEKDGLDFSNITQIRNKYDDITDAKAAFNKEAENQLNSVNALVKEKQATNFSGVSNQLTIFRNYVAQINSTQTDHNNLDATVQLFKDQTEVVKSFSGYMPQYIEAYKLSEQIKQKQIAKQTTTPIPTVANWSKGAKVEVLAETIAAQQNVLKLWDQFSPLKAQVVEAHKLFSSSNDAVLSKYNAEYADLVNGKMTLETGIEAYSKFIETQKVVAEQWQKYSVLKTQAVKAHEQFSSSDDAVLTKYKALYSATASKRKLTEAIEAYTRLIEEQKVVAEQWQKYSVLKAQAVDAHKQLSSSDDAVLAEYKALYNATAAKTVLAEAVEAYNKLVEKQKVVVQQWQTYCALKRQLTDIHKQICASNVLVLGAYNTWYEANFKPQTSLEEGIATYTKLAAIQKSANEYIPLYNKVIENNTLLATSLKSAKCAAKAYKLYFKELDLNWKSEGAVEHISAVLKRQMLLLEISKFSTLKDDEKRVKKLKLTVLDDIIKVYIGNKSVAEPQIEVKAAFTV